MGKKIADIVLVLGLIGIAFAIYKIVMLIILGGANSIGVFIFILLVLAAMFIRGFDILLFPFW